MLVYLTHYHKTSFALVTGCTDSDPLLSTSECSAGGDITISIHGTDFTAEGQVSYTYNT